MRLQKYIAMCGIASRRGAEKLIAQGEVCVNGEVVDIMGVEIDPEIDVVSISEREIKPQTKKYYIMLNKPKGYVTTVSDEFNRPTVIDLIKDINARLYPVGRLDYDTSGLLLLTNDGDFTNVLTHPSYGVEKSYIAKVKTTPTSEQVNSLINGVDIDGKMTAPSKVKILKSNKNFCEIKITIHEGRNRQVRRMCEAVGLDIIALKRISIGSVTLGNLPEGKWRSLKTAEVSRLIKNTLNRGEKNGKSNNNR